MQISPFRANGNLCPFGPMEALTPLLLRLTLTPGAILILLLNDQAIVLVNYLFVLFRYLS